MSVRHKILITVATYPLPSRSYDELVCTAGLLEDGRWMRIYPVPLSFFVDFRRGGKLKTIKYHWIELDLIKRTDDFRPESHSPLNYDFRDVEIKSRLDTKSNWLERKQYCLKNVYTSMERLIEDSKSPKNISLATFKPTQITGLDIESDARDWKPVWKELKKQLDLFGSEAALNSEHVIQKVPYKFFYRFRDITGKERRLMIEDWEISALYWNCLRQCEGDENEALELVRAKYENEFLTKNDIYLFLGTTKQWHTRRSKNPFVITGVFYPRKEKQLSMF